MHLEIMRNEGSNNKSLKEIWERKKENEVENEKY